MAKRGGPRFEELTIKIDKKIFRVINAVCGGDQRKINRLIRKLLIEAISNKQMDELIQMAETPMRKRKKEPELEEEPLVE